MSLQNLRYTRFCIKLALNNNAKTTFYNCISDEPSGKFKKISTQSTDKKNK